MKGKAPTKFKTPDGKEFDTRAEWRDYMMATFYSYKNKHDEAEPLIKPPGSIDGQIFDIADCSNTTMAILDQCEQVQIDMIKNCKVMVGACASSIFIRNCENSTFYTCCRQLRLRDCINCKFYIYSMSEVHIEDSNNVTFAPFRGGYPEHAVHLSRANLDISHNLWYDIFDHNDPGKTREHWGLIPEAEYEPEWYPLGPCENAIPYVAPGSVAKFVDDSSMQSFSIQTPPSAVQTPAAPATNPAPPAPPAAAPVAPPAIPAAAPVAPTAVKHVAVIGTGKVGTTLGRRLLEAGWQVTYGSRNPTSENVSALLNSQPGAKATSLLAAAEAAQFIIIAVPSMVEIKAYQDLAASLGAGATGKIIFDVTNPVTPFPTFELNWTTGISGGEMMQAAFPSSHVYKAFNYLPFGVMGHPDGSTITNYNALNGPLNAMFAGPKENRDEAQSLVTAVGFRGLYVGPIRYSRNLEAMAELWIHLIVGPGGFTDEDWGLSCAMQVVGR